MTAARSVHRKSLPPSGGIPWKEIGLTSRVVPTPVIDHDFSLARGRPNEKGLSEIVSRRFAMHVNQVSFELTVIISLRLLKVSILKTHHIYNSIPNFLLVFYCLIVMM